jgi:hypothetical protein
VPPRLLVLDANVLVLLIVGLASRSYIRVHKRLSAYTEADFDLLEAYANAADRIVVTPNTITEASNLAGHIYEPARTSIMDTLRSLIERVDEVYVESKQAVRGATFLRLGITDAVLLGAEFTAAELLTADLDLYIEATRAGRSVVNFNHYIEANRP